MAVAYQSGNTLFQVTLTAAVINAAMALYQGYVRNDRRGNGALTVPR